MASLRLSIPVLLFLGLGAARSQIRPHLTVEPLQALTDESVTIEISGLGPNSEFTLRASTTDALGRLWRSETPGRSNAMGKVDLSHGKPVEVAMKPFWAMEMAPEVATARRSPPAFAKPQQGHYDVILEVVVRGSIVASSTVRRNITTEDVVITEIRESGMIGRLYEPASGSKHPAVLVLTGSNGGIPTQHAALLAARGYVAFALAYFRTEGLPVNVIELPLEYFERAVTWLKHRPSVDGSRLGVIGLSKGAELGLLLPSVYADMFRAAVALSPSSVVWEGVVRDPSATGFAAIKPGRSSWSWHGAALPFLSKSIGEETERRIRTDGSVDSIEFNRPALNDSAAFARARIPVEKIRSAVLLISSKADRMWPSASMAAQVCGAMREHQLSCEEVEYPDASHIIVEPWLPVAYGTFPAQAGRWDRISLGGTAPGAAHASADSWPKILRFFENQLQTAR